MSTSNLNSLANKQVSVFLPSKLSMSCAHPFRFKRCALNPNLIDCENIINTYDETGALRKQTCESVEYHFKGAPAEEVPIIIKIANTTFYLAGDRDTLRQTMVVYPNGRVDIYEGSAGEERIVKSKYTGRIEHYVGEAGGECLIRVEYPNGDILHFKGVSGYECLWKIENSNNIVSFFTGKQGKERMTHIFYPDGYTEFYQGERNKEKLTKKISANNGFTWFYTGEHREERCIRIERDNRIEYLTGDRFEERIWKVVHCDDRVTYYEGEKNKEHLVKEVMPNGYIFYYNGADAYAFQQSERDDMHDISELVRLKMSPEMKERKRVNRNLKYTQSVQKSSQLKILANKYAKFVRNNDEATAKNKVESAKHRKMRDLINVARANIKPKPYTTPGLSHYTNKPVFVVDPLVQNRLAEDAKKRAHKEASIEAACEHWTRLKKAQEEERMRIANCIEKIRIGKEIGGN